MEAQDIHQRVQAAVNAGDVEAMIALYEPDAVMIQEDGSRTVGHEALREFVAGVISLGGRMEMTTRSAAEVGDLALLSTDWRFSSEDASFSGTSAEVVRKHADGSWRYVIDSPYWAGAAPDGT
jgi:uncharacterized protein (TIGR02246 family)